MPTSKLKWIGLGDSEYVTKDGTFMVQLQGRTWHLFKRVEVEAEDRPTWTWSDSLFTSKRKGECQTAAEKNPKAEAPEPERVTSRPSDGRNPKRAITDLGQHDSPENTNARCYDCGVPFTKKKGHRYGDLCGPNCLANMVEVLDEVDPDLIPEAP